MDIAQENPMDYLEYCCTLLQKHGLEERIPYLRDRVKDNQSVV
jgi:hypothetical protein